MLFRSAGLLPIAHGLERDWKQAGGARLRHIAAPLTIALARCISDPDINIGNTFAWARSVNPACQPIAALLTEGHAHRLAGDADRAIAVLTQAVARARAGSAMHRLAFAHYELAQALACKRQFEAAWQHMAAYARILQTGLEESLTQLGVMHTHIDAHSTDEIGRAHV